ncbi:unnamed protein product [marine sediment metagenome]|uniref:CARDB domain-containing protein n=1 Tax=marine sediment metagenome TaxID=412755 RepID=X1NUX5_9ZZZZ
MRRMVLPILIVFVLVLSPYPALAGGFVITYPPNVDNMSLTAGSPENIRINLKNLTDTKVAASLTDNANGVVGLNYPIVFVMDPGDIEEVVLIVNPLCGGEFNVVLHIDVQVPEEVGGPMAGQVIGGMDIPLRGTVAAAPPADGEIPWPYVVLVAIVIVGAVAYAIKRYWRKVAVVKKWHRSA